MVQLHISNFFCVTACTHQFICTHSSGKLHGRKIVLYESFTAFSMGCAIQPRLRRVLTIIGTHEIVIIALIGNVNLYKI